jgi:hypothetical protein
MKKSILSTIIGLSMVSGAFAATVTYVNESAWLGSSAWSAWTHSQTTETFDSYTTRAYYNAGDPLRGSQTIPIIAPDGVTYNSSTPPNTMLIVRTQGIWDGDYFGNFKTYAEGGVNNSYNPFRVEDASSSSLMIPYLGTGKYLSFFKNTASDIFRISFATGVSAVSLRFGDFGDGGVNSGLKVTDSTGAVLWDSSGKANQTYSTMNLGNGDGIWSFLGFTTDNPNGFTYLDFNLTGDADDNIAIDQVRFNTVPEPGSGTLLILGIGGLMALRRTRRSRE